MVQTVVGSAVTLFHHVTDTPGGGSIDWDMTWGSGSASQLQIQTLHELRGRVTKWESTGPLCDNGSLALLVHNQTNNQERDHHECEDYEGGIHGYSFCLS